MGQPARTVRNLRWYICALLFFATTVNYIDRQVLGILKPTLERELGWRESDFGWIVFAFQCAYAIMMPLAGRIIDWLGTRIGYALAVVVWSIASMSHSLASTSWQFAAARFGLGIGEAANFPAAIKTVADWFPKSERALATGIFNSGSNVGAIVAPLMVPLIAAHFGWRSTFLVTGGLDLIWVALWLGFFRSPREHRLLAPRELELIESDREDVQPRKIRYSMLLRTRAAWAFLIGKFLTDPVWWFYLYWLPGFLHRNYGLDLTQLGPPLIAIYVSADVGSVGGGWLSSILLKRGWSVTAARKTAMLVCAIAVLPVIGIVYSGGNLWLAVALISMAAAAHQGWSANLFTLASDVFPRSAVGSVVGLGGLGGAIGGMLVAPSVGYWLEFSHSAYGPLFFVAGSMYLLALGIIHLLLPKLEQTNV
ncbi:MAG: MFS transporter [Acidobacteriota bacterium]|nr:MFS transporter [Acidobacteriota bacterium]